MSTSSQTYPFVPRSTSKLKAGQYWSIRRDDERFGVGVVLEVPSTTTAPHHAISTRTLVVGLLDKVLGGPASLDDLSSARLADWGFAHVKSIEATSDGIGLSGVADLLLNELQTVSHRGGGSVGLYTNGRLVRAATNQETASLPVFGTWGLTYVQRLASALTGD